MAVHRADEPMSATELSESPGQIPPLQSGITKRFGINRGFSVFGGRDHSTQQIGNDQVSDRGLDHAG